MSSLNPNPLPFVKTNFTPSLWKAQLREGVEFLFQHKLVLLTRKMREQDVNAVFQLEQKIFPDPWPIDNFYMKEQETSSILNIVGEAENTIIAYTISQFIFDELHIYNFAVSDLYRQRGFGKTMLWLLLEIASVQQVKFCHLEVRKSNHSAISLYQKFGFEIVGIRKQYYVKENEDALLMTKSHKNLS